ncbi:hypothetical protein S7711_04400 [Stachybotrys chartarum IBT 7711]|uniref:Protein yippee-like n=1 Tax=Stachybotrys chartarum (strain CBS 109288 / IBT 7711) TaxID=1280523 RepID=A0A084B5I0_STACB|nr:hypothetical protein S7711_04400 [Stachybotrys chartarum IBT 7711]
MDPISAIASQVWACKTCDNPLLRDMDRITYQNFRAVHGKGFLFHNAFNVDLGKTYERQMTTGWHSIRDVYCNRCNAYVGWQYEKAEHETQSYKVGKFLMEAELLRQASGAIEKLQARL